MMIWSDLTDLNRTYARRVLVVLVLVLIAHCRATTYIHTQCSCLQGATATEIQCITTDERDRWIALFCLSFWITGDRSTGTRAHTHSLVATVFTWLTSTYKCGATCKSVWCTFYYIYISQFGFDSLIQQTRTHTQAHFRFVLLLLHVYCFSYLFNQVYAKYLRYGCFALDCNHIWCLYAPGSILYLSFLPLRYSLCKRA